MRNDLWGSGLASSGSRQRPLKSSCEDSNKIMNFADLLKFLSIEETISFWRGVLLHEVASRQTVFLSISKPYSTNVENVSSRAVIAPIVTVLLLLLLLISFGVVVSGVVEHPESGFFDQVTVGRLGQVLMKWVYKAGTYCSNQVKWYG